MFVFGFLGHAQVHPAVKGLMLAWQQMEHPHVAIYLDILMRLPNGHSNVNVHPNVELPKAENLYFNELLTL